MFYVQHFCAMIILQITKFVFIFMEILLILSINTKRYDEKYITTQRIFNVDEDPKPRNWPTIFLLHEQEGRHE